jgi:hypothetical protein
MLYWPRLLKYMLQAGGMTQAVEHLPSKQKKKKKKPKFKPQYHQMSISFSLCINK